VDEYEDRCVRATGPVDVELLNRDLSVGEAPRLTDSCAHCIALGCEPPHDLFDVRLIHRVLIGRVQLDLAVIEKHGRSLLMRRGANAAFVGKRRRCGQCGARAQHCSSVYQLTLPCCSLT
jgi:hypothetical protein